MCLGKKSGYLIQYSNRLWAGWLGFHSWQGQEIFLFSTVFRLALGPTQLPIQWALGAFSLGVKWLGCEADHSPPSSAEVKNGGAVPPLPSTSSWHSD
jgi:hypothetical protein